MGRVDKLSEVFYLDPDVVLQVVQHYGKFLQVRKKNWENCTDEPKDEVVQASAIEVQETPMEDLYEPAPKYPFLDRVAQFERNHKKVL